MKHILKYIFILSVIVCFFPLVVFADSPTYVQIEPGECWYDTNVGSQSAYKFSQEVRIVRFVNTYWVMSVNEQILGRQNRSYPTSCTFDIGTPTSLSGNVREGHAFMILGTSDTYFPEVPIINASSTFENALYYTYGEGAVDPIEPTNWGILRDVSYNTRIAGNGSASSRNVDYINWNNLLDANGNDINECTVEVQVVPGGWTGSTEQELLSKGFEAFNGSQYSPVTLATVNAPVGIFSISWQGVVNELGWNWESLYSRLEDELWRINGWYYQVRLLAPDGYVGSWQTVYTAASGSAQGLQNVVNSNTFNENLYQYVTDLSIINNQQTIQYTINDTTYLINNPNYEPEHEPDENGNDYTDILRAIRIGVVNLLTGIAHLPENIIGLLPDLFTFNFVEELPEDQDLETAVRDTLDETYYGDLVVALSRFKDTFNDNRNFVGSSADSGMIIIPDLGFDWAGEHITIVESQVFNLYNWVASDPDMFTAYNLYLNIVDGIIYISLFRTLFKRMLGSLDKGG